MITHKDLVERVETIGEHFSAVGFLLCIVAAFSHGLQTTNSQGNLLVSYHSVFFVWGCFIARTFISFLKLFCVLLSTSCLAKLKLIHFWQLWVLLHQGFSIKILGARGCSSSRSPLSNFNLSKWKLQN